MAAHKVFDDEQITGKVQVELGVHDIDRDQLNVETEAGVVRITGAVDRPELREKIRELARRQTGVRQVELDLEVTS